jgi:hypothetical protein
VLITELLTHNNVKGTLLMALTINQSDLYRFERLVSKLSKLSEPPVVCFIPCNTGNTKLAAFCTDAVLTMPVTTQGYVNPFTLNWKDFKEVSAKKNIIVSFDVQKTVVHVAYGDDRRTFSVVLKTNTLPNRPTTTGTHSKQIFEVLQTASKCTDTGNARVALAGVCLRGATRQVISTTGTQLLVQEGYSFPWGDKDVICPVSKIIGSKELKEIDTDEVLLGSVGGWVYFSVGEVQLWLREIEGKFPPVANIIEPPEIATCVQIHQSDADFILSKFDKLPGAKAFESSMFLALGDKIQVRAHDAPHKTGVALELTRSTFTGENVTLCFMAIIGS